MELCGISRLNNRNGSPSEKVSFSRWLSHDHHGTQLQAQKAADSHFVRQKICRSLICCAYLVLSTEDFFCISPTIRTIVDRVCMSKRNSSCFVRSTFREAMDGGTISSYSLCFLSATFRAVTDRGCTSFTKYHRLITSVLHCMACLCRVRETRWLFLSRSAWQLPSRVGALGALQ